MNPRMVFNRGLVAGSLLLLSGCGQREPASGTDGAYEEESQFLVHSILVDLLGMVQFAAEGTVTPEAERRVWVGSGEAAQWGHPDYRVRLTPPKGGKPATLKLELNGPIWDPAVYAPVLAVMCRQAGLNLTAAPEHGEPAAAAPPLVESLLAFNVECLEQANSRVSRELRQRFRDPAVHERAALVLGVFGLREAAGVFWDVRDVLCRMTAHLAFVRALDPRRQPSLEGALAEVALLTLMGNEAPALARLEQLPETPPLPAWKRALRAWITGDYRELDAVASRTRLEDVSWFAARVSSLEAHLAWEKLPGELAQAQPDFCRLALAGGYSVELGHQLHELSLPQERAEIRRVFQQMARPLPGAEELAHQLNAPPEPCVRADPAGGVTLQVLSWGHWAQFLQRHLCHAWHQNHRFLQSMWGVPEAAAEFRREMEARYGQLQFAPFVRCLTAQTQEDYQQAVDACARVIQQQPQRVSAEPWMLGQEPPSRLRPYRAEGWQDMNDWFRHNPPPGTAYDVGRRIRFRSVVGRADAVAHVEALHALAPNCLEVTRMWLHVKYGQYGRGQPVAVLEAALGKTLEYSVPALQWVSSRVTHDPDAYERFMTRAAASNPAWYFTLGEYFARRGDEARAVQYYEWGVARGSDAVQMANNVSWLVEYYHRQGRAKEADQLADAAAEVYSALGLKTKGDLLFWRGQYAESFEYYRRIEERYDAPNYIFNWWINYRDKVGRKDYDAEIEKRLTWVFPQGIRPATLDSLPDPPKTGVLINSDSASLQAAGLKRGDIIVGLFGQRVETTFQYFYLLYQRTNDTLNLLVWDGSGYREVIASPPAGRFGVRLANHRSP